MKRFNTNKNLIFSATFGFALLFAGCGAGDDIEKMFENKVETEVEKIVEIEAPSSSYDGSLSSEYKTSDDIITNLKMLKGGGEELGVEKIDDKSALYRYNDDTIKVEIGDGNKLSLSSESGTIYLSSVNDSVNRADSSANSYQYITIGDKRYEIVLVKGGESSSSQSSQSSNTDSSSSSNSSSSSVSSSSSTSSQSSSSSSSISSSSSSSISSSSSSISSSTPSSSISSSSSSTSSAQPIPGGGPPSPPQDIYNIVD